MAEAQNNNQARYQSGYTTGYGGYGSYTGYPNTFQNTSQVMQRVAASSSVLQLAKIDVLCSVGPGESQPCTLRALERKLVEMLDMTLA